MSVKRLAFLLAVLVVAGCGAAEATQKVEALVRCADKQGWQKLANRIDAPVFCPSWLPDPLDGVIDSRWNNIDEVDRDRSYLMSWVWQETGPGAAGGEVHVNLRGYPGRTAIPKCVNADSKKRELIPCFSDPGGKVRAAEIAATVFNVNQDADQWHVLLAWRHRGSLYTLSEHLAPPLTYRKVVAYVKRELRSLVRVEPAA